MSARCGDELVVALDRDRRPVERRDRALRVGERDERVERPELRAGRAGRLEHLRAEHARGVDQRLAAVQAQLAGEALDGVVRHGEDDQLDLVEDRRRLGEGAGAGHEATEPLAPRGVPRGDRDDRPAGPVQRRPERRARRRPAPTIPIERRLAGLGVPVRMGVAGLGVVVVVRRGAVGSRSMPRSRRSSRAAGSGTASPRDGRIRIAGAPRLHRPARQGLTARLGVRFHASSLPSAEVRQRATP